MLVTDGGLPHTLALVRSLTGAGIQCDVVETGPLSITACSRYCARAIRLASDERTVSQFGNGIVSILKGGSYDQLIAVNSFSVRALAPLRHEIEKYTRFICHDSVSIELAFSKVQSQAFVQSLDLPVPVGRAPQHLDEVAAAARELNFPVIIKRRSEFGPRRIGVVERAEGLVAEYQKFCERYRLGGVPETWPLIQERLTGRGCGFFALYHHGRLIRHFMHERIREMPAEGGPSSAAESIDDPVLFRSGKLILDRLKWHGVAMVEFKRNESGVPIFIEINPKFWGSLELSIVSGVNFPVELCRLAQGVPPSPQEPYRVGVRFQWPFSYGDLSRAIRRPREWIAIGSDFLNPRVHKNVRWVDWAPSLLLIVDFIRYELRSLGSLLKSFLRGSER